MRPLLLTCIAISLIGCVAPAPSVECEELDPATCQDEGSPGDGGGTPADDDADGHDQPDSPDDGEPADDDPSAPSDPDGEDEPAPGDDSIIPNPADVQAHRRIATLAVLSLGSIVDHESLRSIADTGCSSGEMEVTSGDAYALDRSLTLSNCDVNGVRLTGRIRDQRSSADSVAPEFAYFSASGLSGGDSALQQQAPGFNQTIRSTYTSTLDADGARRMDFHQTIATAERGAITESGTRIIAPSSSVTALHLNTTYQFEGHADAACPGDGRYSVATEAPVLAQGAFFIGGELAIDAADNSLTGTATFDFTDILVTANGIVVRYELNEIQQIASDGCTLD